MQSPGSSTPVGHSTRRRRRPRCTRATRRPITAIRRHPSPDHVISSRRATSRSAAGSPVGPSAAGAVPALLGERRRAFWPVNRPSSGGRRPPVAHGRRHDHVRPRRHLRCADGGGPDSPPAGGSSAGARARCSSVPAALCSGGCPSVAIRRAASWPAVEPEQLAPASSTPPRSPRSENSVVPRWELKAWPDHLHAVAARRPTGCRSPAAHPTHRPRSPTHSPRPGFAEPSAPGRSNAAGTWSRRTGRPRRPARHARRPSRAGCDVTQASSRLAPGRQTSAVVAGLLDPHRRAPPVESLADVQSSVMHTTRELTAPPLLAGLHRSAVVARALARTRKPRRPSPPPPPGRAPGLDRGDGSGATAEQLRAGPRRHASSRPVQGSAACVGVGTSSAVSVVSCSSVGRVDLRRPGWPGGPRRLEQVAGQPAVAEALVAGLRVEPAPAPPSAAASSQWYPPFSPSASKICTSSSVGVVGEGIVFGKRDAQAGVRVDERRPSPRGSRRRSRRPSRGGPRRASRACRSPPARSRSSPPRASAYASSMSSTPPSAWSNDLAYLGSRSGPTKPATSRDRSVSTRWPFSTTPSVR